MKAARWMCVVVLFICAGLARGQANSTAEASRHVNGSAEERTARAFDAARGNPLELRAFLVDMPKGGDLHVHLEGAVYAESWIRAAADEKLCVTLATMTLVAPGPNSAEPCKKGEAAASNAFGDQHLYDQMVDAFSMRGFVATPGVTGHDHFFDSFDKFTPADEGHEGQWVDEVARRAASQNEQYLELMVTPGFTHTAMIARQVGWDPSRSFSDLRDQLLAKGLRDDVAVVRAYLDHAESVRKQSEHCGEADAATKPANQEIGAPRDACKVEIRYIYQVLRAFPPEQVFAQTLLGFETAAVDPRIVAINYVQPEDDHTAMADYSLHMRMIGFLHDLYPKTHITLHAGELAPGMVPPDGLCCHIREAVEVARAERIGHGVDVMYEDRPYDLLKEMAAKHVMVEINLTSNDVILGITGKEHPLPEYRKFGVPVALSTDDEGVSRIDLTHEYVRAVETYDLKYADLKKMVRTSIEHNFLPGESLWAKPDDFGHTVAACGADELGAEKRSSGCAKFLQSSEKAQAQWELERRFQVFEAGH